MNAIRYQRADEPKSKVKLADIRTNGGTQSRAGINPAVVEDYAAAILDGAEFPKMVIFYDGTDHWLADGFHRHAAYLKAGVAVLEADVRQGTQRDAILFSVGANSSHGLRRTNDDKRRAVLTLLQDAEWSQWPQTKIAQACGVSQQLVSKIAGETPSASYHDSKMRTVERNGTTYSMQTEHIGGNATERVDVADSPFMPEPKDDDEITAEDLAADPEFQKAVEALKSAKALYDEVQAMPPAEPMTPEKEELYRRAFGTQEERSNLMAVINATKLTERLPNPDEMAKSVPPTMAHAVDVLAILNLSTWFEQFARAWERREGASA